MRAGALAVLVVAAVPSAYAQHNPDPFTLATPLTLPPVAANPPRAMVLLPREPQPEWWAPLASAALPGMGQAVYGQKRWLPYVALEVWAWLQYADARRESSRRQRDYQTLARDVARSPFPGPHPDGDFEYYEHMLKNIESGDFDVMPGGAIDPETDTATYNGSRWLDARRLYWEDPNDPPPVGSPAYVNAIEFYTLNAIPTHFRWSWRLASVEYDAYRRTIVRSNVAYKRSVEYLGVIIANHALSAVDAFVTLRLRTRAEIPGHLELQGQLPLASILPRH
jgi:hypothetical protein